MISVIASVFLFLFSSFFLHCQHIDSTTVTIDLVNTEDFVSVLEGKIPTHFYINNIIVQADAALCKNEFFYLMGLEQHAHMYLEDLAQGMLYLKCKHKYSSLALTCIPLENDAVDLQIQLTGLWTLHKVIFKGFFADQQLYKNSYLLEPGDYFDIQKHKHSLERITQSLQESGYLGAEVFDYFHYDHAHKSVTAYIVIDAKDKYIIDAVSFVMQSSDPDAIELQKKLNSHFIGRLHNQWYTQEFIDKQAKKIKYYLAKAGYADAIIGLHKVINAEKSSIDLTFSLSISKRKNFIFSGNHFFSRKQLREMIMGLGPSAAELPEDMVKQEIIAQYHKKGFFQVQINVVQESDYFFFIKENMRAKIKAVVFEGLQSNHELLNAYFSELCSQPFDEQLLQKALEKCTDYLLTQGYLHVKILQKDYIPLADEGSYQLHITIEEGPCFYIKDIIMPDNIPEFCEHNCKGPFAFTAGQTPFNPLLLSAQKEWLLHYFHQQANPYVHIHSDVQFEGNLVIIIWKIDNQQALKFGKVIVQGNCSYPFEHIMRELSFAEGQDWQKEKLEQSIARLRKLDIFETIHVYPGPYACEDGRRPVIIKLKDDDPFEIRVRGGIQQVSKNFTFRPGTTYKIGGSLLYKNPFNEGGTICAEADLTFYYRNLSLVYKRPWLFSWPMSSMYKLYSNKYIQPVYVGSDKPLYQALQQGFLIGVSRSWPFVDLGFNIGFETMETSDLSVQLAHAINFKARFIDKKVPYIFIEPNAVINYLDDQLNPSRGWFIIVSLKSMISFNQHVTSFTRVLYEQSFFIPFYSAVLGLRLRFGHIFNREFDTIMPPERFYLGGPHSVRSYERDFAPPLGLYIEEDGKRQLVPQGGKTMVNGNLELRFPLYKNLGGVIFQDLGMLVERSFTEAIVGNRLIAGTGFGIRYHTPIGPLRFDMGFKWKRLDDCQKRYAWFFSLGQAF